MSHHLQQRCVLHLLLEGRAVMKARQSSIMSGRRHLLRQELPILQNVKAALDRAVRGAAT